MRCDTKLCAMILVETCALSVDCPHGGCRWIFTHTPRSGREELELVRRFPACFSLKTACCSGRTFPFCIKKKFVQMMKIGKKLFPLIFELLLSMSMLPIVPRHLQVTQSRTIILLYAHVDVPHVGPPGCLRLPSPCLYPSRSLVSSDTQLAFCSERFLCFVRNRFDRLLASNIACCSTVQQRHTTTGQVLATESLGCCVLRRIGTHTPICEVQGLRHVAFEVPGSLDTCQIRGHERYTVLARPRFMKSHSRLTRR